jgi:UDP-N-acetylmuramoyl-tripeptide--D-alanyl-D-alanine ligase
MEEKLALARDVAVVIVGTEPAALAVRAKPAAGRVVTAGLANADVTPESLDLTPDGRPILGIDGRRMVLPLLGRHQAANALLVWAVVRELGLDHGAVARAIEQCTIPGGRGELQQVGGMTILNDCYNANPASFRAAIDVARTLRAGRTLVFVAGTMRELGPDADELHRSIAAELVALEADTLAGVGAFVAPLEALRPRIAGRLLLAADAEGIGRALAPTLRGDEVVVLKASRGVALERILPVLTGLVQPTAESA